jgi:ABC-2 type transport system permease protein
VTDVGASLLMSLLVASLGVVISLRSATVQGAQQALIFSLLIPLMIVQVLPMILISVVPNGRAVLKQLTEADFTTVIAVIATVLVIVNALTIPAALARFKRSRLILD